MVLRAIEQKIEALFAGVFGRAFRTNVQPVELARKLAKEMDDHKTVSVSRVYVPNEYTVYLSPSDREQFEGYENSLQSGLEEYVTEHAKREDRRKRHGRAQFGRAHACGSGRQIGHRRRFSDERAGAGTTA